MSFPPTVPSLSESLYNLRPEEVEFYCKATGINDPDELKQHILAVQREAYSIHPYPCIRRFSFTSLKISRHPAYPHLLRLGNADPSSTLLDLGCCFGNDARKAVADGFSANRVYASDLRPEFWQLGHKLFNSTEETCLIKFIPGNVFDDNFLPLVPPTYDVDKLSATAATDEQHSLAFLVHRINFIHTSAFFHLFNEEDQLKIAKRLGGILSPKPGSMIFGSHRGSPTKGVRTGRGDRLDHSPESWNEMWNGTVFQKGSVECTAFLREEERKDLAEGPGETPKVHLLVWSVKRL